MKNGKYILLYTFYKSTFVTWFIFLFGKKCKLYLSNLVKCHF